MKRYYDFKKLNFLSRPAALKGDESYEESENEKDYYNLHEVYVYHYTLLESVHSAR